MPDLLHAFDSGFVVKVDSADHLAPQQALDVLLNELNCGKISYHGWEFNKRLIRIANSLFGDIKQWIRLQARNDRLTSAHYGLIEDIVNFINTGSPLIELQTRSTMIMYASRLGSEDNLVGYPIDKRESLGETLSMDESEVLAAWVAQDQGVHYLLHTLKYIFGTKTQ